MPKDKDINFLKKDIEHAPEKPDTESKILIQDLSIARMKLFGIQIEREQAKNTILLEDHSARKKWATIIFIMVLIYLFLAPALMIAQPFLKVHDNVMITFLGTTVVNTIGLLAIVLGYFFPKK